MHIYIYIYTCLFIYTCTHTCVYTYLRMCWMYICVDVYMYTFSSLDTSDTAHHAAMKPCVGTAWTLRVRYAMAQRILTRVQHAFISTLLGATWGSRNPGSPMWEGVHGHVKASGLILRLDARVCMSGRVSTTSVSTSCAEASATEQSSEDQLMACRSSRKKCAACSKCNIGTCKMFCWGVAAYDAANSRRRERCIELWFFTEFPVCFCIVQVSRFLGCFCESQLWGVGVRMPIFTESECQFVCECSELL